MLSEDTNSLIELAAEVLQHREDDSPELERLLAIDGLAYVNGRLVPTTPGPAQLGPELSLLEADLRELGLPIAAEHYRQAHDAFVAGNREAANAMLRSFVEDLVPQLASQFSNRTSSDVYAAVDLLKKRSLIDEAERDLLKAFWKAIQDKGPHAGLTPEQEALFRLHVGTAIARYLLHKTHGG